MAMQAGVCACGKFAGGVVDGGQRNLASAERSHDATRWNSAEQNRAWDYREVLIAGAGFRSVEVRVQRSFE